MLHRELLATPSTMPPDNSKVRRWVELISALLGARRPLTFLEIAGKVPAYMVNGEPLRSRADAAAPKRAFERDKDELRDLGVPIESVSELGDEDFLYSLRVADFYQPYVHIVSARGVQRADKVTRGGYQSVQSLNFDPDELQIIAAAAARTVQIGDANLAELARNAMRKFAYDQPIGAIEGRSDDVHVPPRTVADARLLSSLGSALFKRKRLTGQYHSMGSATPSERTVEPYGLFYVSGHWYLCARDVDKGELRNFRVSRMSSVRANASAPNTRDYDIPSEFSLREHAKSRQAWEIGDVDSSDALIEFRGQSGATMAARAIGEPVDGSDARRRFRVRRSDNFARWLLSFAGEVAPVAPDTLVHEYQQLVQATFALYARAGDAASTDATSSDATSRHATPTDATPTDAAPTDPTPGDAAHG